MIFLATELQDRKQWTEDAISVAPQSEDYQ